MRDDLAIRLLEKLTTGAKTARQLASALDVSQPSISRGIANLGSAVLTLGRGRATQYARPRVVRGLASDFPVYRINTSGDAEVIGRLHALMGGEYWWQSEEEGRSSRLYTYLPWFIQDMRPDGFLGRAFANKEAIDLGLPEKLNDWNDDDVLIALSRRGENHIGNLIIGDESIRRYLRSAQPPLQGVEADARGRIYPELAEQALRGEAPGSSAGGEQQKFTASIQEGGALRHVLVKFSSPLQSQEGRRWADLLVCEHWALRMVAEAGIAAAQSRILASGDRIFLEVDRFDRVGSLGRASLFSLRAIDAEYAGIGDDWVRCAVALQKAGVLSADDVKKVRWLKAFGSLIGNTDMHTGNLSFIRTGPSFYALAPVYDMLPMLYRPVSGDVPERVFSPKGPTTDTAEVWAEALRCAVQFWEVMAEVADLSDGFRAICKENRETLLKFEVGPKIIVR